jgi:phage repressor protein C with HTH and peptisase S24 domain
MSPTIEPGELILVTGEAPQRGDLALVEHDNNLVAHRLQARRGTRVWLKGDHPDATPHWVPESALVGRVTWKRRDLRAWLTILYRSLMRAP